MKTRRFRNGFNPFNAPGIMHNTPDNAEGDGTGGGVPPSGDSPKGDTGSTFTQADLDRIVTERLNRERAKYADYDAIKEKASQFELLEQASLTDLERTAREAHDEAWNAAMAAVVPQVVRAEFKAAAKGVLTPEQLDALLEDVDLTRYANEDGSPDDERITKKIAAFAPANTQTPLSRGPSANGQGRRSSAANPSVASGRDLYTQRHRK